MIFESLITGSREENRVKLILDYEHANRLLMAIMVSEYRDALAPVTDALDDFCRLTLQTEHK